MDHVMGRITPRAKVLEEFQKHNDELKALIENGNNFAYIIKSVTIVQ
ncbi:hypothetical protein [Flavobacterium sp.]